MDDRCEEPRAGVDGVADRARAIRTREVAIEAAVIDDSLQWALFDVRSREVAMGLSLRVAADRVVTGDGVWSWVTPAGWLTAARAGLEAALIDRRHSLCRGWTGDAQKKDGKRWGRREQIR